LRTLSRIDCVARDDVAPLPATLTDAIATIRFGGPLLGGPPA
jgi:hypothetical protein